MMTSAENKTALRRAIEHFNNPLTRNQYFNLYAPNALLHRFPSLPPGLDSIKKFYHAYWAAFPDIQLSIMAILGEDDLVACAFEARATHQGVFLGIPATGRPLRYEGVTLLRFQNGQCVERWSQTDTLAVLRQLDAFPGPK
jgi:predicted ester cyclase